MNQSAEYIFRNISRSSLIRALAVLSILGIACMTASAQLTLDDFTKGKYVKVLKTQTSDTHYEALPSGSLLGAARETVFTIGPNPYAQSSILDIGKGICIVGAGFENNAVLEIVYGFSLSGVEVPLGLNLGAYTAFQLNVAGVSSAGQPSMLIEVDPHSGGYYTAEVLLPSTPNPSSVVLPFSSFAQGGTGAPLTQAEASDIDYIVIIAGSGYSSFGITSFQAVN